MESFDALLSWHHEYRSGLPHVAPRLLPGHVDGRLCGYPLRVSPQSRTGVGARPANESSRRFVLAIPSDRGDLAALLGRPNGVTTYHLHYSEGCVKDAKAVKRIAGCEGVRLHPHPGHSHRVLPTMLERGALETLLPNPQ